MNLFLKGTGLREVSTAFFPSYRVAPECTLDDGAGRHIGAGRHTPPILLVYNMANLIGVDPSMHSFVYDFVIDLAILQKYYVLTLES